MRSRGVGSGRGGGGRPHGGGSLKRFTSRGDFGLGAISANPTPFTQDGDTSGWRTQDFGYGGGGMKYVAQTLQFDRLIRAVEGMLNYPYPLGKRGIDGTVNVRLTFGPDGHCDSKRARLSGASPYLRVYVLALLKKLCGLERLPEPMSVDLSFAFLITDEEQRSRGQGDLTQKGQITGNVLFFTRTFPKGMAEYQLGPIRGVWFAPVVALDWPWVVEHWEEWVEGKDPLAAFR